LFEMKRDVKFFIQGPVGKGLDINPSTKGSLVFFCGGTGVLPFLDTFAFLLRKAVNSFLPALTIFKDETFTDLNENATFNIYVYFQTKEDVIGKEIFDSLRLIQEKFPESKSMFTLTMIYTQEGGRRLTPETSMEILNNTS
jgi:hypothetical protein